MEIGFLPWRISSLTLSILMSSVLTIMHNYVCVHVRTSVLLLVEAHVQWNNELEPVLPLGNITVSLILSQFIMVGVRIGPSNC